MCTENVFQVFAFGVTENMYKHIFAGTNAHAPYGAFVVSLYKVWHSAVVIYESQLFNFEILFLWSECREQSSNPA